MYLNTAQLCIYIYIYIYISTSDVQLAFNPLPPIARIWTRIAKFSI